MVPSGHVYSIDIPNVMYICLYVQWKPGRHALFALVFLSAGVPLPCTFWCVPYPNTTGLFWFSLSLFADEEDARMCRDRIHQNQSMLL